MTRIHRTAIAAIAAAGCLGGWGVLNQTTSASATQGGSPAATPTVYSVTYAGTDLHSLNPGIEPQLVDGGGVLAVYGSGDLTSPRFFEVEIDLPVGSKVTSVSVTASGCYGRPSYVFGSYQPTTRNTLQNVT